MRLSFLALFFLSMIALAGCNLAASPTIQASIPTSAPSLAFNQPSPTAPVIISTISPNPTPLVLPPTPATTEQAVFNTAFLVVSALKDRDMAVLATTIDPRLGLRFSPYAAVKDADLVFTPDKLDGLLTDNTVYTWGAYDGTGESMQLSYSDYFTKFVYDVDFANAPQVSLNHRLGVSSSLDNAADYYPGAMIVEFYFPGFDPSFQGMDWRSLRLVFSESDNTWFLVGIIHDQWTT